MYLADRDIHSLLPAMNMTGPNSQHPFEAERQVQPCSIDLRVSNVFWRPSRRRRLWRKAIPGKEVTIDLRRSDVHDLDVLRDWKRFELAEGDSVVIRPGQILMARIYERFQIPPGHAGKIEGRSSYARLGLSVHCTGDFINPGWEGFMPLQLCNSGPYPLRIAPFFSICQLLIVRLTSDSVRSYGDGELRSKYVNDDGGPSLWWRDARVDQLQRRLGAVNVSERIRQQIVETVRFQSPQVLERLQHDIDRRRSGEVEHADQVLNDFAHRERQRRLADNVALAAPAVFLGGFLGSLFAPFGVIQIMLIVITILSTTAALAAYVRRDFGYLGPTELQALKSRPTGESS